MLHGSYLPPKPRSGIDGPELRPAPGGGYRNLFGDPGGDAFGGYGDGDRTEALLVKLSKVLERPYSWNSPAPGARHRTDNPRIPAGYTYLAQLVAHDLTFLGSSLPPFEEPASGPRNLRAVALDLETIYGGGPVERPSSYCLERDGGGRFRLRLGLVGRPPGEARETGAERARRARDLPRAACPLTTDAESDTRDQLTEVLISDPRNDDHVLVAQTAVLFHHLHNAACDRLSPLLSPEHDDWPAPWSADERRARFSWARRLVSHTYRTIVRDDLMRKLLCEPVHAHYRSGPAGFLDRSDGSGMPVEFSHAAFRVGHAMVQPAYRVRTEAMFSLEDLLRLNSELSPGRLPPSNHWLVRWSHFYELNGVPANLSRRLSPSQTRPLFTSPLIDLADDRGDPALLTGLPRRDLLRGDAVKMRSVESLIRCIKSAAPHLAAASPLLASEDGNERRAAISTFLASQAGPQIGLTSEERDLIAADPPLLLYVLLEAALEMNGLCLGVLGSIIVAEVIFRALDEAERAERFQEDPQARNVFGTDPELLAAGVFRAGTPRSMPDLIRFLAGLPHLADAHPPFV